jgi:hypothetical protein
VSLEAWLSARRPKPPENLSAALRSRGPEHTDDGGDERSASRADELARVGRERLEGALAALGRHRASAFRLLEADAFLTYACEAALEADDPRTALRQMIALAAS